MKRDSVPYNHWQKTWRAQCEARSLARYFFRNWKMACERAEIFLAAKESLAAELLSQTELLRQNESLTASNIILLRDVDNLKTALANSQLRTEAFMNQERQIQKLKSDLNEAEREIVRRNSSAVDKLAEMIVRAVIAEYHNSQHASIAVDELPY